MSKDDIQSLLVKYISNEASPAESDMVRTWINLHPENELYFIELNNAWHEALAAKINGIDEEAAYEQFKAKTQSTKVTSASKWYKLTVLLILPFILAVVVFKLATNQSVKKIQLSARNGSIKKLLLPDGTLVWLNSGSTINYDVNFGKTNRIVFLTGEALFDVGHRITSFPFLVKTRNYTIKDVGTQFNLKAYADDPFFETTVLKGEVSVEDNDINTKQNINRMFIKPKQVLKIFYNSNTANKSVKSTSRLPPDFNEVQITDIDSAKLKIYDGWKDNLLYFDGSRLDEIARVLERKYDVTIRITDSSLREIKYSGNFNNIAAVSRVLDIIKQNTPLSYAVNGKQITITKTIN